MQKTGIEYLDYTWNPIAMRCNPCSPGCDNCWHLRMADRMKMNPTIPENERKALAGGGPFVLRERELDAPLRLKKSAVIGVQFMGDLFHESVPDTFIEAVFEVMYWERKETFIVLTKRPQRMLNIVSRLEAGDLCAYYDGDESGAEWVTRSFSDVWPRVYLGLTICNQQEADEKIPEFLKVPGKKWLSIEPMLESISFRWMKGISRNEPTGHLDILKDISCVILGGETGPHARPMHPDWVRSVRDQCKEAGVPFYFKQWGSGRPIKQNKLYDAQWFIENNELFSAGRSHAFHKNGGRLLDGREHNDLPWGVV